MEKGQLIQKIYHDLEVDIVNGVYPIGSKLPSERELSVRYNGTRIVVREAIAMLTKSGIVETLPQRGTFIKNFYKDVSLDSLINISRVMNKLETRNLKAVLHALSKVEIEPSEMITERKVSENLKKIEAAMLRKKLHDDPAILAECDYEIFYETAKALLDPISIAIVVSLKPLQMLIAKLIYLIISEKDEIIDFDIKIFKALNSGACEKALAAFKEKTGYYQRKIDIIEKIENKKLYLCSTDGRKGKVIDLEKYY